MKQMKTLVIVILTIGFFQCKSLSFDQNPPFTVNSATYIYNVGGMPGSSSATIHINYSATKNITFERIYFQGREAKVQLENIKNKTFLKGFFNTSTIQSKEDLILHKDGKKEVGNSLPKKKIPFELKDTEAVISYKEGDTVKYYKIENVKKGKTKFYQ